MVNQQGIHPELVELYGVDHRSKAFMRCSIWKGPSRKALISSLTAEVEEDQPYLYFDLACRGIDLRARSRITGMVLESDNEFRWFIKITGAVTSPKYQQESWETLWGFYDTKELTGYMLVPLESIERLQLE